MSEKMLKPILVTLKYIHSYIPATALNQEFFASKELLHCLHLMFELMKLACASFEDFEIGTSLMAYWFTKVYKLGFLTTNHNFGLENHFKTPPYEHSTHMNVFFIIKVMFHFFFNLLFCSMKPTTRIILTFSQYKMQANQCRSKPTSYTEFRMNQNTLVLIKISFFKIQRGQSKRLVLYYLG